MVSSQPIASQMSAQENEELSQLRRDYEALRLASASELQARERLQKEYDEQMVMVKHQQKLFTMVKTLYGEQVQVASSDPLTSLPNHRLLMSKLDEELLLCRKETFSCAVLFLDLDRFKSINDTYGHRAGDAVLQEVACKMRNLIRQADVLGRYGGEEFMLILHKANLSIATEVAERLRREISLEPCTWENEETQSIVEIGVTVSIGVAIYGEHGETRDTLIEAADQAMYVSKHAGRNRVSVACS